jgi:short-subunit dehydrogenase
VLDKLFVASTGRFDREADIVVANAGRGLGGAVTDADPAQFEEVLKINVSATLAVLQKAAQKMVVAQQIAYPNTAADIVIIGSVLGRNISTFSAVYGASKFAVHALAAGLRREMGPKGVRVSLVEPGIVASGFQAVAGYSEALLNTFNENMALCSSGMIWRMPSITGSPGRPMCMYAILPCVLRGRIIGNVEK